MSPERQKIVIFSGNCHLSDWSAAGGGGCLRGDMMPDNVSLIEPRSYQAIASKGTVPPRGAGTVLVAACPMLHLTNTVSGRRLFHKQPPEFCIECHTATILAGRTEFTGRVSSNTIRRDSLPVSSRA